MSEMSASDWRPNTDARQTWHETRFSRWNRRLVVVVGVVALAGALLPGVWGTALSIVAVAVIVAAPIGRVVWLIGLWWSQGDRRFVVTAVGLLAVIAVGIVAAALRGS